MVKSQVERRKEILGWEGTEETGQYDIPSNICGTGSSVLISQKENSNSVILYLHEILVVMHGYLL